MYEFNKIYHGDCLEIMKDIKDKSIDMVLCDLPYQKTACEWDKMIPFNMLWKQYERIIKDNGVIALFGSQPFTTDLINSNRKLFRYEWIWEKSKGGAFALANKMPMKRHENILIFYKKLPTYNPQKTIVSDDKIDKRKNVNSNIGTDHTFKGLNLIRKKDDGTRFPKSVQFFNSVWHKGMHPTEKPVLLCEYLIKTYTNENEVVLDNCIGSGTTAIACMNTDRQYIGIEKDEQYYNMAIDRVSGYIKEI